MKSIKSLQLPDYNQSCNQTEAVKFIQATIRNLKEAQEDSDFHLTSIIFEKLSDCHKDLKKHRFQIVVELLKQHFVLISSSCISKYNELGYFTTDDIWDSTSNCLNCLIVFADSSSEIVDEILKTNLPSMMMDIMFEKQCTDNMEDHASEIVLLAITLIYNIARFSGNEYIFKSDKMKQVLVDIIKTNEDGQLRTIALMLLAFLVNETESHLLDVGKDLIEIIVEFIRTALESNTKRILRFKIWELVNGLKYISANDTMKKAIVNEGGIKLLFDIVNNSKLEKDIEMSLGVLWNLCFDKNIKTTLIKDFHIKNVIKIFENHSSPTIKECCRGILWLIEEFDIKRMKSSEESKDEDLNDMSKFDVFLSYAQNDKSIVLPIFKELEKSKVKVWIDINHMKGSALESMAGGIENSKIFVLAISDSYRKNPNCRLEAEYALKLNKIIIPTVVELKYKPIGWLGIIMGCKTYYEFSERRIFIDSFQDLLSGIQAFIGIVGEKIENSKQDHSMDSDCVINAKNVSETNISQWSTEEVEKWLIKNGLGDFKSKFLFVDGKLLKSMIRMNFKAPDYLYKTLEKDHGLKLLDILKLNAALTKLN